MMMEIKILQRCWVQTGVKMAISKEIYNCIEDIYIELPFSIDEFLKIAIATVDYPFDGTRAEIFVEPN